MQATTAPRDYSLIAPLYDKVFHRPLSEGHTLLGRLIRSGHRRGDVRTILEVGVGSGLTFSHLPTGVEYTGIDVNEKMLEEARKKSSRMRSRKIELQMMDASRMSFKSNRFDLVIAPSVLSAMEEPMEGLKEIIRVTKKGGRIAIIANLRKTGSKKSDFVRLFDPLTRKLLGFRLDLREEDFTQFKNLRLIEQREVNSLLGCNLSTFLLFEKV